METIQWESQTNDTEAILLGSSYCKSGLIGLRIIGSNTMALVNTAGYKTGNMYNRLNEDSIDGFIDNDLTMVVISDAHFGGLLADTMILSFINKENIKFIGQIFNSNKQSQVIQNLKEYVIQKINSGIVEILPKLKTESKESVGDATVIVAIKFKQNLYWVSIVILIYIYLIVIRQNY